MTQSNQGKNEGKIRFFITVQEWIWTLLTQEPFPSSDGYNNWIDKTKTQCPWSFPHSQRPCGWKSPFLYPLPLSINVSTPRSRSTPRRTPRAHALERERVLRCGPDNQRERFTYGFRLIRGLNLFAFKFLPVNIPEKRMLFNVTFTFRSTTQTFARVFGHQLQEKEKRGI